MNWKNLTIGKKTAVGFGIVLTFLGLVGILSFTGVGGIVNNAGQVIDGNKLDGLLAQKEVDHLNWVNKVNALLTDDEVTTLQVQTDDHKCGFGKWLYGEGRKEAERLVPNLAPLLREIEGPHSKLHQSAIEIGKRFQQADASLPGFLAGKLVDHLKWVAKVKDLFLDNEPKLVIQTDDYKCGLGKWLHGEDAKKAIEGHSELAVLVDALKEPHQHLHQSAIEIQKVYSQVHPGLLITLKDRLDDHRRWAAKVSEAILHGKKNLGVQTDPTKCAFGKFLASEKAAAWMRDFPALRAALQASKDPHNRLHTSAIAIEKGLGKGNKAQVGRIYLSQTIPALAEVGKHFQNAINAENALVKAQDDARQIYQSKTLPALAKTGGALEKVKDRAEHLLEGQKQANRIYAQETVPALQSIQKLLKDVRSQAKNHIMTDEVMLGAAQGTKRNVTIVAIVAAVVGILMAFFIARGITTVLQNISNQMGAGAGQVAAASGQVSSASQSLAEGSAEQAASLEETSSSLEQMSSMTKQNADNANQADTLMKDANRVVAQANDSMTELITSMEEISKASEETSKIIKTIDEIAFQTNLLALNAAVEAARAGEAGAGFAVVADEVRNLALRAADAAKNTADLIEGTVTKVKDGSELVTKTNEAFAGVATSASKVGELVGEIAAASSEQAHGIEQVNKAIAEMDKVVQQSAASAEECASAAEEMHAQCEQTYVFVNQMAALVGGSGETAQSVQSGENNNLRASGTKADGTIQKALAAPRKRTKTQGKQVVVPQAGEVKPDEVIPMDEAEFKDL